MNSNLWIYSTPEEMRKTSASLILFGAEKLKSAKIIKDLDYLRNICQKLGDKTESPANSGINEFIFEYLIDCVKIVIFFENYMKAELISRGFCVYKIKREIPEFKNIANKQYKEPITLKEIDKIAPFEINVQKRLISHTAIKDTTLGFNELINSKKYLVNYQFDNNLLAVIKELNAHRNKLHFQDSIYFSISNEFITKIERIKTFVNQLINERISSFPTIA